MRAMRHLQRSVPILCVVTAIASCGGGDSHVPASKFPLVPGSRVLATDDVPGVEGNALIRALLVAGPTGGPTGPALARREERLLIEEGWHATNSHVLGMFAAYSSDGSIYLTMTAASASLAESFFTRRTARQLVHRKGVLLVSMAKKG